MKIINPIFLNGAPGKSVITLVSKSDAIDPIFFATIPEGKTMTITYQTENGERSFTYTGGEPDTMYTATGMLPGTELKITGDISYLFVEGADPEKGDQYFDSVYAIDSRIVRFEPLLLDTVILKKCKELSEIVLPNESIGGAVIARNMEINHCNAITSIHSLGDWNIPVLKLNGLKNLTNLEIGHPSGTELVITSCPNLVSVELRNISDLQIQDVKNVNLITFYGDAQESVITAISEWIATAEPGGTFTCNDQAVYNGVQPACEANGWQIVNE